MNSKLFIIIPVHNRAKLTRDCLLSLRQQTTKNFTVVVIDDGSTDGTSEMIKSSFPEVVLLSGDGNLWWSGATNLGVRYALEHGATHVMTLNDDVTAEADFVEKMMFWAEKHPRALLGAVALDRDTRRLIYGGEIINWKWASYVELVDVLKTEEQHGLHEVTQLPGRGLLVPAEVFSKIGLFDANHFPQAVADHDFTRRAISAGYRAFCNYDAKVLVYSNSIGGLEYRKTKSVRNYFNHLFGIKGSGNLANFFFYAIRNCPKGDLPFFLVIGMLRRVFGYLRDWAFELLQLPSKKGRMSA
jgi:GT2 family glycosyltransferase